MFFLQPALIHLQRPPVRDRRSVLCLDQALSLVALKDELLLDQLLELYWLTDTRLPARTSTLG